MIDEEAKLLINGQYDRAKRILSEHKEQHNALANLLIEKEVIFAEDVERIFGKRPWTSRSAEIMATEKSVEEQAETAKKDSSLEKEPETNLNPSKTEANLPGQSDGEDNTMN